MFPEIQKLLTIRNKHKARVEADQWTKDELFEVRFYLGTKSWKLLIEDEYGDFNPEFQLICIYLVLRALEDYKIEQDFLHWCNYYGEDPADARLLTYYRGLSDAYNEIESILGEINSQITTMDYDLQMGAFADLKNH